MIETRDAGTDHFTEALRRMVNNSELRREMLWLRAMEKGDEHTARDLERVDRGLRERLAEVRGCAKTLDLKSARDLYGRAQDERFELALRDRRSGQQLNYRDHE